jgi:hypothetical protein
MIQLPMPFNPVDRNNSEHSKKREALFREEQIRQKIQEEKNRVLFKKSKRLGENRERTGFLQRIFQKLKSYSPRKNFSLMRKLILKFFKTYKERRLRSEELGTPL